MHTCLTLSNVGGHWYVERAINDLISALRSYCDSLDSCEICVEGPSGEGEARAWSVGLKLRIFDEIVRVTTRAPEGNDSQLSLARVLANIFARARAQLDYISGHHAGCCAQRTDYAARTAKACAMKDAPR